MQLFYIFLTILFVFYNFDKFCLFLQLQTIVDSFDIFYKYRKSDFFDNFGNLLHFFYHLDNLNNFEELRQSVDYFSNFIKLYNLFCNFTNYFHNLDNFRQLWFCLALRYILTFLTNLTMLAFSTNLTIFWQFMAIFDDLWHFLYINFIFNFYYFYFYNNKDKFDDFTIFYIFLHFWQFLGNVAIFTNYDIFFSSIWTTFLQF